MSGSSPTLDSLIALGFERKKTSDGPEGVGYRFAHLDLDAVHVTNTSARDVVLLSGVLDTGHTLATIEGQIPNDLTSALEAAVWVSHTLRYHRSDLEPLPEWYVEGERRWDLLPRIHQMREGCPDCRRLLQSQPELGVPIRLLPAFAAVYSCVGQDRTAGSPFVRAGFAAGVPLQGCCQSLRVRERYIGANRP